MKYSVVLIKLEKYRNNKERERESVNKMKR